MNIDMQSFYDGLNCVRKCMTSYEYSFSARPRGARAAPTPAQNL